MKYELIQDKKLAITEIQPNYLKSTFKKAQISIAVIGVRDLI